MELMQSAPAGQERARDETDSQESLENGEAHPEAGGFCLDVGRSHPAGGNPRPEGGRTHDQNEGSCSRD
jgi:hypothetical protein